MNMLKRTIIHFQACTYVFFFFFFVGEGGGGRLIQQNYNKLKIVNFRNHENPKLWGMGEVGGGVADVNLYFQHSTFLSSHFLHGPKKFGRG